jgi:hypothetical protein
VSNRFSSGKNAIAQCDRCNFRFPLKELKQLVIKTKNVNILVCPECWDPDQPQLQLGMYPVSKIHKRCETHDRMRTAT